MSLIDTREEYLSHQISKPEYIDKMHLLHQALFEYGDLIKDTDIAKIEITDTAIKMTSRESGITMLCDREDKRIVPIEILNFQRYEESDADMIFRLASNCDTILDIGANIGWYSINLAKRFPHSQIFAFEPIPKTFSYLQQNIALNATKGIEVFNLGFAKEVTELTFYYYPSGSGNASSAKLTNIDSVQEIKCPVIPLDDFVSTRKGSIDFIKCDVEGAELFVFQGGLKTLKSHRPIVFTEMLRKWAAKFDYHPNEIIALFDSIGYKCFAVEGSHLRKFGTMNDSTIETNFFFLHPEKHQQCISELVR